MSQDIPQVIHKGLVTLSRQLESIHNQTRLYADIGLNCRPNAEPLHTSADSLCGTMEHLADQLEESLDTVKDLLDFAHQK